MPRSSSRAYLTLGGIPTVKRYLVTGCAGFIGSHLVESLLARGDHVVGIDSFTDYYPRSIKDENLRRARRHAGFTLVTADLAETSLGTLFGELDGIFHLAAQPGVRGSWGNTFQVYVRDNVLATQRVFEAAAAAGIRVVFASTSSVYGEAKTYPVREDDPLCPVSPYGVTKLTCEQLASTYADAFGLDVVSLRYFSVYGPRQRPDMAFTRIFLALAGGNAFSVFGDGAQSRDFTYVGDAVSATMAAMEAGSRGAVYNVGGGEEATLHEVIEVCERLSGSTLRVSHESKAAGDVRRTAADTSRIESELGWRPATRLEDGLAAQLESVSPPRTRQRRPVTGRVVGVAERSI